MIYRNDFRRWLRPASITGTPGVAPCLARPAHGAESIRHCANGFAFR
ncbi:hypothetical protein B1M_01895 [Burkholderia sp. TJI49]|nr:hypothetical protein B1M_01895 [Burkholderia sp. TJI49]